MEKSIISEGKTTNEAIENGLKKLNVTKNMVNIKVIESETKRSFFDILAPRVVKVEITVKDDVNVKKENQIKETEKNIDINDLNEAKNIVESFIKEFLSKTSESDYDVKTEIVENNIDVTIKGDNSGYLIGYRGETLNSLQNLLSAMTTKNNKSRVRVILDVEEYRNKRKETLENLAIKISKTVGKTGKTITLEPMSAYERKIIHSKLQDNKYVKTHSIGEEPNRRVVISKNN